MYLLRTIIKTATAVVTAEIVHRYMEEHGWELLKTARGMVTNRD